MRLEWRDLKDRHDLGEGFGQATALGKGSKTGVALLPASVYLQVRLLRSHHRALPARPPERLLRAAPGPLRPLPRRPPAHARFGAWRGPAG